MGWSTRAARKADLSDGAEFRARWAAEHPEFSVPAAQDRLDRITREAMSLSERRQAEVGPLLAKATRVLTSHRGGYASIAHVTEALNAAEGVIVEGRAAEGTAVTVSIAKARPRTRGE